MKQRYEIILAGSGGQGLVLGGKVLAQAAILEGKNVVQTQSSLGDSQRGALSVSELIIDQGEIIFQQVQRPDLILALSDAAIKKYADPTSQVPVIYDNSGLKAEEGNNISGFPFVDLALKVNGAANMVALGAIIELTGVVSFDSLVKSLRQTFKENAVKANVDSVCLGMEVAKAEMGRKRAQQS